MSPFPPLPCGPVLDTCGPVWFRRRAYVDLLGKMLELEGKRVDSHLALETRRVELEVESLERRAKVEQDGIRLKQELREKRRHMAALRPRDRGGRMRAAGQNSCRACVDPTTADLTTDEISYHNGGHQWLNN